MRRYGAGEQVGTGSYLSLSTGEFVGIPGGGAKLPGEGEVQYVRVPLPGVVTLGPLLGLVFVVFVPFAAVAAIVAFATTRAWRGLSHGVAQVASPAWQPGVSFFTRRRGARKGPAGIKPDQATPEEQETAARHREEK